ncbi:flavin reductase like domain-containing protein [Xylaria sp. FL0064]|nr:flavin reductase like domain-containing protein [Xylaria sp. FL0064]
MQSIRGLRRAIASTSPRYALLYSPRRRIASSVLRRSVKQTLRDYHETERPAALREGIKAQPGTMIREQKVHTFRKIVRTTNKDADSRNPTKDKLEDAGVPEESAKGEDPSQDLRDLYSSVTATMAKLPHPAVVITTLGRTYNAQAAAGVPVEEMRHPIARGVTVSSLTSLCIRPRPHVMFNMTLPSTMYEALITCKDFNVHVLTPDEAGARVARVFTRGNRLPLPHTGRAKSSESGLDVDADLGVFAGLKDEGLHHVEIANRAAWHEQFRNHKQRSLLLTPSTRHGYYRALPHPEAAEPVRQLHHVPCLRSRAITEVLNCRLVRTIHPELPNAGQNVIVIGEVVGVTSPTESNGEPDRTPVALSYANRKYRSVGDAIETR